MSEKVKQVGSEKVKHVGFKTVALIIGWLLGAIWTILNFITWLGADLMAENYKLLANWLIGLIACIILFPLFAYIAHILWKFAYSVEDLIGGDAK